MQNFGATNKEHYGMLWYFLEWSINNFLARIFFTQNQSAGYFFLKSPIPPPQKFNGRLIKLHQLKSSWCRVSWAIIRQGVMGWIQEPEFESDRGKSQ